MSLGGRGEFEYKDAAICLRAGFIVRIRDEVAIGGDHYEVQFGVVERCATFSPAEMDQF